MRPLAIVACALCTGAGALDAQVIGRDSYHEYLPPRPSIVGQTSASAALHLFGDTAARGYRDSDPADGIDDARARRLLEIAEHFSPILRRNNAVVPRDLEGVLGPVYYLQIDTWRGDRRLSADSLALFGGATAAVAQASSSAGDGMPAPAGSDALESLLTAWHPRAPHFSITSADDPIDTVLFFDMPGTEPKSWRAAAERLDPRAGSRIFVHPFLTSVAAGGAAQFQLVLQFWFFYPFNNAVNDHEGDWEHMNVIATTRAAAASARPRVARSAALDSAQLASILDGRTPVDSLVIAAAEYYFHQNVTILDYLALTDSNAIGTPPRFHSAWEDHDYVRDAIRARLTVAGGLLATHPVVYVGGDNKGPDELLSLWPRFAGSYKRNSGSSYPFPGTWQTVAGFGVTEQVRGSIVPPLRADCGEPWYECIADDRWLVYRAADLVLLPDWERLEPLLMTRPDVRDRWTWMVLPIYFGFPAVRSTGAGLLKHADLGNIAPMAPPFQSAWNRTGVATDYDVYSIRVLRTMITPGTPWAALQNGWGVLNAPFAVWGLMPGYNVALVQLMPWTAGALRLFGAQPPRTFAPDRLPRKFTVAADGAFLESGGRDFAAMLPARDSTLRGAGLSDSAGRTQRFERGSVLGPRLAFNLYFGDKFSVENTFSYSRSDARYVLRRPDGSDAGEVLGTLSMRQLTGGVRYGLWSALDQLVQVSTRAGYGWLWYSMDRIRLEDRPFSRSSTYGGYRPPLLPSRDWWPNTWYAGGGAELFVPERLWLLHLLGYGLRADCTESFNKLRFPAESAHGDVIARRGDVSLSLVLGW